METHKFAPESRMMSHAYSPASAGGAIKAPIYQTSTFVFETAAEGKAWFEAAYGLRDPEPNEKQGFIYSRLDNPNLNILEQRLCLWDQAESAAVFQSGMAAISTLLLTFLKPGDLLLYNQPLYGGSAHFIEEILPSRGIEVIGFSGDDSEEEIIRTVNKAPTMIYMETPSNPTNKLTSIALGRRIADHFSTPEKKVLVAVDNTYMGPLWQHPLNHGADLVLYSATKYIGGHSDVIAGAILGENKLIEELKGMRTFLGNMPSPNTAWLLMRSLETLKIRMDAQAANARTVARFLHQHPQVTKVHYLGLLDPLKDVDQYTIYREQCESPGAMISFEIKGGEAEAFAFLDQLKLIKLAVSLGSTESLVQHPASMTHIGMLPETREALGITDALVRLSVGIENPKDLIHDLGQALKVPGKNGQSKPRVLSPNIQ